MNVTSAEKAIPDCFFDVSSRQYSVLKRLVCFVFFDANWGLSQKVGGNVTLWSLVRW